MRRFNYTGRRRLDRGAISITMCPQDDGALECDASADFNTLRRDADAPGTAEIFLEAYNRTKFERFDFGTLDSPAPARRLRLARFGKDENVLFRLKVVETQGAVGKIVALADRIRPRAPEESHQSSMLPVSVEKLDDLVYKLDFDEDGPPTLVLNESLDVVMEQGVKALARTPLFVSLVLPEVVRQVLTRILVIDEASPEDDEGSSWSAKWIQFASRLNPEEIPELGEGGEAQDRLDWIEGVVCGVGRNLKVLQRFEQGMSESR